MLMAGLPLCLGAAGPAAGRAGGAVWVLLADLEGGLPRLDFLAASFCTAGGVKGSQKK